MGRRAIECWRRFEQFAREKLLESGEEVPLRARHLEFFLKFSEQAEPKLHGARTIDLVASDWERSTRTCRRPLNGRGKRGSTQPALRLAKATEQLADVKSLLGVGTQAIPAYQEALELWRSVEGADKMIEARLHGKIVLTVADLKWRVDSAQFANLVEVAAASNASLVAALEVVRSEPPSLEQVRLLTTLSIHAAYAAFPWTGTWPNNMRARPWKWLRNWTRRLRYPRRLALLRTCIIFAGFCASAWRSPYGGCSQPRSWLQRHARTDLGPDRCRPGADGRR